MDTTVIVVGAGTAGCIVAARLTEDPGTRVVLLERGPDRFAAGGLPGLRSANWLDALDATEAFYDDVFATKIEGAEACLYRRGLGVGGSGAVNAMLALPGLPGDYARWADEFGLDHWGWRDVEPWVERLKGSLVVSSDDELTPVDRALLDAASELGLPRDVDTFAPDDGSGRLWRNARDGQRFSSAEEYLDVARDRPNLRIVADAPVDRLRIEGGAAVGVRRSDGTSLDADHVILCAGTFESAAILLRSELPLEGIGRGLQDHPAISVYFSLRPEFRHVDRTRPAIGTVLRTSSSVGSGDIHLLPVHGTLLDSTPENHGLLMAAVMTVTSTGSVELDPDNPAGPPVIHERMLSTDRDRVAMRDAVRTLADVLRTPAFRRIIDEVFIDERGTPLAALDDDDAFETWLRRYVGDYFHAVGTARMGNGGDPGAVVDQCGRVHGVRGAYVFDASIMPTVPSANSNLPTAMIAERLAATWRAGRRDATPAGLPARH